MYTHIHMYVYKYLYSLCICLYAQIVVVVAVWLNMCQSVSFIEIFRFKLMLIIRPLVINIRLQFFFLVHSLVNRQNKNINNNDNNANNILIIVVVIVFVIINDKNMLFFLCFLTYIFMSEGNRVGTRRRRRKSVNNFMVLINVRYLSLSISFTNMFTYMHQYIFALRNICM